MEETAISNAPPPSALLPTHPADEDQLDINPHPFATRPIVAKGVATTAEGWRGSPCRG
ncbi:MAG: hypothetical protein HS103_16605 [Anaerolineales bacterium]|nr:hypothetical protein [Anaerolineales bacterium]